MFFQCGINDYLARAWGPMFSSVNLLLRDSLFAQVLLAKFVSSFSSSVASSEFSYFFLLSLIYELLSLAGGFKETQVKVPPNLLTKGAMRNAKVSAGFMA